MNLACVDQTNIFIPLGVSLSVSLGVNILCLIYPVGIFFIKLITVSAR